MSEESLNRLVFSTRMQLDSSIVACRATEKVLNERLLELGRCQIALSIAEEKILTITTEYTNVVERSEAKILEQEKTFFESRSELEKEIVILKDKISELQTLLQDVPETPAEHLLENLLRNTLSYLHSSVVYFAALTLNSNPQSLAGRELKNLSGVFVATPPNVFSLSVKEKQVVRENIRAFVVAELDNSEYANIRDVIYAMAASPKSWKTFHDLTKNSKVLHVLASDNIEFDAVVNALVEFILEQLK